MFDHVTIRVSDRVASESFYETVLRAIGIDKTASTAAYAEWDDFSLTAGDAPTTGLHVGFCAWSHEDVDRFWQAGVDAGYRSDGEPGPRPEYRDDYYGGFLLDPDGNSAEAVYHGDLKREGNVDHLWIRVADLDAGRAFYELIAPWSGFEPLRQLPGRAQFKGRGATFSLVDDTPHTQKLHIAFPAASNETVEAFHAAALAAGHVDNGVPGERPQYHADYYAAYVLDPAGANVELVNHNR